MNKKIYIDKIPALLWGNPSQKVFIYIHGQGGNKEEAEFFSKIVCKYGWQVISIDLPEHGERTAEKDSFNPWNILPELEIFITFVKNKWSEISLYANSIGAYFSMLAYKNEKINSCFFVSPVLDMKQLILDMMSWANVTMTQLEQYQIIETDFGQTLSWKYLKYVLHNPIEKWNIDTEILYSNKDELVKIDTIIDFSNRFSCPLTIYDGGEHWFHTEKQLEFLQSWILEKCCNKE